MNYLIFLRNISSGQTFQAGLPVDEFTQVVLFDSGSAYALMCQRNKGKD